MQSASIYSQLHKDLSFELRYPIPLGNNFINKAFDNGYSGIIDLGVDYSVIRYGKFSVGLTFNSALFRMSETDVTLWTLTPKIKVDFNVDFNKLSVIPRLGIGYSNWRTYAMMQYTNDSQEPTGTFLEKTIQNGLSVQASTKVLIKNNKKINWFIQLAYEFTKLEKPEAPAIDSKYNRNIHLVYPGIGLIWNFRK